MQLRLPAQSPDDWSSIPDEPLRSKMFVQSAERYVGLFRQTPCGGRLVKGKVVSWCLDAGRWQNVFVEKCQAKVFSDGGAHRSVCTAQSLFASAESLDSTMSADTMHVDDWWIIDDRICKHARVQGTDCIGIQGVSRQQPSWILYLE